ncbi:alpha/beta fold hydrolase [Mucilaginibacter sp. RS28]|uniref:Alpha/beta fold hydrolase n=1 Tax=Mucilaginibacter straminoryzae TaxID=2932774 RepID=A0A9X1X085_9SPHI|nr:alpha/beta fold hydrolase [Mucilaginibacter straminoryzae]MCJ8208406.1 alpha/beta fold hydrolase [Mucilaginibacter straminoryzae]
MISKLVKLVIAGCMAACASLNPANCQTVDNNALPYKADSVIFEGKQTGLHYGATITMPNGPGRHTAVVLVSGTGQQDRDGKMAGHKMFAEIADYLTRNGIVVLRVDDRGVGKSNGNYATSTTGDFAADVLEAFHYLQTRPEVNPKHIGLLGHSEGGMSIAIAASKEPKVAFLISIAGLCMDGYDALIMQNRDLVNAAPISNDDKNRYNQINEIMFKAARQYADSANLDKVLNERYANWKKTDDEWVKAHNIQFDHFRFPIWSYVNQATSPWYRFFIKYDPAPVLAKVNIPILALNGDKDVMVAFKENLANWKNLPAAGHDKDVTTIALPGLNHLFLPCQTCTPQEYASIKAPFSPDALKIIADWVKKRFK